jgi:hypothetical protein
MKAVEFPLGNLREYFFNEILSKMTPRMGDYCVVDRPKGVPFNEHFMYGGNMWDYMLLHIILTEGLILYVIAYSPYHVSLVNL